MEVKIAVRHHMHLGEEAQRVIRDKASKLLHFFDRIMLIEVTVDLHDEQKWVEFIVTTEHKTPLVANAHHKDVLGAVDLVLDKLETQVRRYKEKLQDHRRTPSIGEVAGAPAAPDGDGDR